jgi:hypothetical protein
MVKDDIYYFFEGLEDELYEELEDVIKDNVESSATELILRHFIDDEIIQGQIVFLKPIFENVTFKSVYKEVNEKLSEIETRFKAFTDRLSKLYDSVAEAVMEKAKEDSEDEPDDEEYNFIAEIFINDIEEEYSDFIEYLEKSKEWEWDSEYELKKKARAWWNDFKGGTSGIEQFFLNIPEILRDNYQLIISAVFDPLKHYPEDLVI